MPEQEIDHGQSMKPPALHWYYDRGGRMIHASCGGEVLWLKDSSTSGGHICDKCGAQDEE